MRPFHFRLDKVLAWRRTELELEHYKMKRLSAELEETERSRAKLAAERAVAEHVILRARLIQGADLNAHAARLDYLDRQERALLGRRAEQQRRIAEAHRCLLEARRRLRLLERLKLARQAEWRTDLNRELEAFAAEAHLARWAPSGVTAPPLS